VLAEQARQAAADAPALTAARAHQPTLTKDARGSGSGVAHRPVAAGARQALDVGGLHRRRVYSRAEVRAGDVEETMLRVAVIGTGSALPSRAVATEELVTEALPDRDAAETARRLGIRGRRWVDRETAADLGASALRAALDGAGLPAEDLRRIVFVSSTGGDWLIPATANAVAARLGLEDHCGCLDLNNACTGFLSALDLGARLVATGEAPIGIVTSEVFSPHIGPESPRSYIVMGDVAAATILGEGGEGQGVLASDFGNDGSCLEVATLAQAGLTGRGERLEFGVGGRTMNEYAVRDTCRSARAVLDAAGASPADVRWCLPHQPNGAMLDLFLRELGYAESQTFRVVDEVGSVGAASVALALDRLWRSGRLAAGDLVLLVAVGGGISRGAVLLRA